MISAEGDDSHCPGQEGMAGFYAWQTEVTQVFSTDRHSGLWFNLRVQRFSWNLDINTTSPTCPSVQKHAQHALIDERRSWKLEPDHIRSRQPLSFTQLPTYGSFESNFDQRLVVFPSGFTENKFLVLGNYWKAESAHDNTQRVKTAKICSVRPYIKLFNISHISRTGSLFFWV